MLKAQALANAFALASIALYLLFYLLKLLAPPFFELVINSQFLGADIASQIPEFNFANFIGFLIAVGLISWLFGFLLARIYNRFAK